jgi:hypothetical protein
MCDAMVIGKTSTRSAPTAWATVALLTACASAPQPATPQVVSYLAKGERCREVAELAGTATAVKIQAQAGKIAAPSGAPPESIVGYAIDEDATKLGFSHDETRAFVKQICDAPAYATAKWEILRANLYYTVSCRLATAGTPVRPYATLTKRLQSCLDSPDEDAQRACAETEIK